MSHFKLPSLLALACTLSVPVSAHQMFIKPESHSLSEPKTITVELVNGTYDKSENSITRSRMLNASITGDTGKHLVDDNQWYDRHNASYFEHTFTQPGTYVLGLSTKASNIGLSPKEFIDYLSHEGLDDDVAVFNRDRYPFVVNEQYAKHVKALVQVGQQASHHYKAALGYPIEIIPQNNPFTLSDNQVFKFQVVFEGEPLPDQIAYIGFKGDGDATAVEVKKLRTDSQGFAEFIPGKKGQWYIQLIHMDEIQKNGADYRSEWATLTFAR